MVAQRSQNGFTLIEVMVVMVIIAIMSALIAPRLMDRMHDGRITATQSQLTPLKQAISMFELDFGRVPNQSEGLDILLSPPENSKRYLDSKDLPMDGWKNPFVYQAPGEEQATYTVSSLGADGIPGGSERNSDIVVYAY